MSQPPPPLPPPPPGGPPPDGPGSPPPPGSPPLQPGGPSAGPPRRSKAPLVIALVVLAVVVVGGGAVLLAQGGDGRSEDEQAYIDALTDYTEAQQEEDGLNFDAEESRCFAEGLVDAVGVDSLQELATPEEVRTAEENDPLDDLELDRDQAEAMYDDTAGCIDYRETFFLDNARENGDLTDAQLECVDRALTDEIVRAFIVATFDEDDEAVDRAETALSAAAAPCEDA